MKAKEVNPNRPYCPECQSANVQYQCKKDSFKCYKCGTVWPKENSDIKTVV
jgi:transcription initiation factor TFIIIB Brf1 subunit/transcription initiation factor TFIIB